MFYIFFSFLPNMLHLLHYLVAAFLCVGFFSGLKRVIKEKNKRPENILNDQYSSNMASDSFVRKMRIGCSFKCSI